MLLKYIFKLILWQVPFFSFYIISSEHILSFQGASLRGFNPSDQSDITIYLTLRSYKSIDLCSFQQLHMQPPWDANTVSVMLPLQQDGPAEQRHWNIFQCLWIMYIHSSSGTFV